MSQILVLKTIIVHHDGIYMFSVISISSHQKKKAKTIMSIMKFIYIHYRILLNKEKEMHPTVIFLFLSGL